MSLVLCKLYLDSKEAEMINARQGYNLLFLTSEGFVPTEGQLKLKEDLSRIFIRVDYGLSKVEFYWRRADEKGNKIVEGIVAYLENPGRLMEMNDEMEVLRSLLRAVGLEINGRGVLERLLLEKRIKEIR